MPLGSPVEVIMCDAQTSTGVGGSGVIGFGGELRYSNGSGVNRNRYHRKVKVRVQLTDSTSGATATVKVQTSNDNSSYTDMYSFPMSIATGNTTHTMAKLFDIPTRYFRVNVTALTGGSAPAVNSYAMLGTFGV